MLGEQYERKQREYDNGSKMLVNQAGVRPVRCVGRPTQHFVAEAGVGRCERWGIEA